MSKSLLILGGTGFIGKHVARRAIKEEYETYILCRIIPKIDERIKGCKYLQCDLTNIDNMKITNLEEANQFVSKTYRKGWSLS